MHTSLLRKIHLPTRPFYSPAAPCAYSSLSNYKICFLSYKTRIPNIIERNRLIKFCFSKVTYQKNNDVIFFANDFQISYNLPYLQTRLAHFFHWDKIMQMIYKHNPCLKLHNRLHDLALPPAKIP